jgi:SAM-dependent methyltransferase
VTQNIYDDPAFFAGYSQLRRSREGLDGAPEWPSLRAMLPPVRGLRVVDLGCGFGWFCRWAAAQGAAHVLGLDLSEAMLARARSFGADERIVYAQADLAQLTLPAGAFDLAYSSLALHYVAEAGRLLTEVHTALAPGGWFVFSTEHPVFMAPSRPGWVVDAEGRRTWPVDDYAMEGPRVTDWFVPGVVKHHRMMGTTINGLIAAGFAIRHVEEFFPTPAQIAGRPELAEECARPMFLLVSAQRP